MRLLCFCLFVLCPVFSQAQEGRKVSCRFVCFEGAAPPPPLLNVFDKGIEVTCTIPANTFSEPVVCFAKGNTISFLSSENRLPLASVTVPALVRAAILVFLPTTPPRPGGAPPAGSPSPSAPSPSAAPGTLPWRVVVIEDTIKNFPDGGAFVANLYKQDIRFVLGENKIVLKSGSDHGFARPEKLDAFNMAPVVFQFQQDETWRTTSESLLRFVPGMRYLIFAYVDPSSGRPRISTFQDFMPVPVMQPVKATSPPAKATSPPATPRR